MIFSKCFRLCWSEHPHTSFYCSRNSDACKAAKIQAQLWGYKGKVVQKYTNHTVSRVKLEMRKYTWVWLPCHFKLLVSFMWDVMILRYVLFFSGV